MNRLGKGLLFLFLSGLVLFPLLEGAEPAGALEDLQEINERIEETKDELTRTQKEERSVLSLLTRAQRELVQIETELAGIEERLRRTDAAISGLQRQLTALEKEIIGLEGEYQNRQKLLHARLVAVYKYGTVDYVELLFSATNFADLVSKYETVSYFLRRDLGLLEEMLAAREELTRKEAEYTERKNQLLAERRNYSALREKVAEKRKEKAVMVEKTRAELKRIQDNRESLEAALDELERLSKELEEQIRKKQRTEGLGTGKIVWPARGRISSPFGWRMHPILKNRRFHSGIDIAIPSGTPVQAADSGVVMISGWNGGYGYFIAIDHGKGISTAYAHNSRLLVKEGDVVTKGQTIALSGSTGWSTGPHLHFEVRENGTPVNPMNYLP
jgi:murein DD-endopeptidase MepM/ murein hydrolase activator NlpD